MEIRVVIDLPATPSEVWTYLRDVTKHSEWMTDALSVEITSETTEGPGLTFDCLTAVGPFRLRDRMEVVEWDPESVMGVKHSGIVTGTGRFTLSAFSGGTRFSWHESIELPLRFAGKLGEPLANLARCIPGGHAVQVAARRGGGALGPFPAPWGR